MTTISVEEAQAKLPELISEVAKGEEVAIVQGDRVVARLLGAPDLEESQASPTRRAGSERTEAFWMAPDFDEPLEEFREYME